MDASRIFWLPLLLMFIVYFSKFTESCSSIPLSDVKIAATIANATYYDVIEVGKYVPDTTFTVTKVDTPYLFGEPLRVVVAEDGSTTVVCFRGTVSKQQFYDEAHSALKPATLLQYGDYRVSIMPYFWSALEQFRPDTLIPGGIKRGKKYIITGHSLGGALASLFSVYMKVKHYGIWVNPRIHLITFGTPRVGDESYAKIHDKLIPPSQKVRFVYQDDIVPHSLSRDRFMHHSREVWIWKIPAIKWWWVGWKKSWTVCEDGDDPNCSAKLSYFYFFANYFVREKFSHAMKWYLESIKSPPSNFYDRDGISRWSFEEACQ